MCFVRFSSFVPDALSLSADFGFIELFAGKHKSGADLDVTKHNELHAAPGLADICKCKAMKSIVKIFPGISSTQIFQFNSEHKLA